MKLDRPTPRLCQEHSRAAGRLSGGRFVRGEKMAALDLVGKPKRACRDHGLHAAASPGDAQAWKATAEGSTPAVHALGEDIERFDRVR